MMALTQAQMLAREGKLTASRVKVLMEGEKEAILNLWREMVGDPAFVQEDLAGVWPVQLGSITEGLNLDWYERKTGRVLTKRGDVVVHPSYNWAASTLDGFDAAVPCAVETKHVGGFEKLDKVIQRYMPQMHWQMECTETKQCAISIIVGAQEPVVEYVNYNKEYADELLARAHRFMQSVWNMEPPVELNLVSPPSFSNLRDYDYTGNNHWAAYAADWIAGKDPAKKFEDAKIAIKEMFPHDGKSVSGHGVTATRTRDGRITIKPTSSPKSHKH